MKFSTKLILSISIVGVVTALALGLMSYFSTREILQESIKNAQAQLARNIMNDIDRVLFKAYQDIQVIAADSKATKWLAPLRRADQTDSEMRSHTLGRSDVIKTLHEKALLTGPWDIIFLVDDKGIMVASTFKEEIGDPVATEPNRNIAFQAAMRGEIYYSDLVISDDTGNPTIIFAAPVRDEKRPDRPIVGAVIGNFLWHVVLQMLDEIDHANRVHLFNREGMTIATRTDHKHKILQGGLVHSECVKKALIRDVANDSMCTVGAGDEAVLACYAMQHGYLSYKGGKWGLLLEMPLSEVFAPINQLAKNIVKYIVIIMISIAGAFYFIGKILTLPIETLTRTVQAVAQGDFSARARVTTSDEVGILATSFNKMVEDLEKTTVSKEYVDNIMESMTDTLVVVDADAKIKTVNIATCELLGYEREELLGKPIETILESKDIFRDKTKLEELFDIGRVVNYETEYTTEEGGRIPILFSSSVMKDKDNSIICIVCTGRDITERKRAEEDLKAFTAKLQKSNQELQGFVYIASHDLQEPLRKVMAFGDRLKAKCGDAFTDQGRDYLERMQKAAARMQTLINGLLMFSRVTTKARPYAPVDLAKVAKDVISDLEVRIEATGGRVELGDLPLLDADPLQMRQLFQNLIGNALKFHKEDVPPHIKIFSKNAKDGASSHSECCEITVEDNGIGFEEKYVDRIFGVFQRLHGRNEYEGAGIGLSVCRKIVERHDGQISAKSAPGQGASFIVTLPAKQFEVVELPTGETGD